MIATANLSAPSVEQLAPNLATRVKPGDLAMAPLVLIGIGIALVAGAYFTAGTRFSFSYLVGYMGVLGIVLCALFFTMLQHITRAGWSVTVRRIAENIAWTLPVMLLLFIPVIAGSHDLFHHWMEPNPADKVLAGKAAWLNKNAFFIRVGIYFLVWLALAWFFRSSSLKQDQTGDPAISLRLSRVAAPSILLFALSITFASIDWMMSLAPHWFSTMFGVIYFAGSAMVTLAVLGLACVWLRGKGYLGTVISTEHYHDIGKLMFAFMVFWAYTSFSQYMLIWYANLPEETEWYLHRTHGGWHWVFVALAVGHFLVPFAFLMSRHIKRNTATLTFGALFLVAMHWLDMQFQIMPNIYHEGPQFSWTDVATFLGVVGVFAGMLLRNVASSPLIPERDPRLAESLHFHNI